MSEQRDWLVIKNLVLLVRRLVVRIQKYDRSDRIAKDAMTYLAQFPYANKVNSILRDTSFGEQK